MEKMSILQNINDIQDYRHSPFFHAIHHALNRSDLSNSLQEKSLQSAIKAMVFLQRIEGIGTPTSVVVDEDGFVILQWRCSDEGTLLTFSNDDWASYSIRTPGGTYGSNITEFNPTMEIPNDLIDTLKKH
jgi:hypothetical protein